MEVIGDLMVETKKPSQEPSSQTVGQAWKKHLLYMSNICRFGLPTSGKSPCYV